MAGRDRGVWAFEAEALREQIGVHLELFARLPEMDLASGSPRVAITPLDGGPGGDVVERSVCGQLRDQFVGTTVGFNRERGDRRAK